MNKFDLTYHITNLNKVVNEAIGNLITTGKKDTKKYSDLLIFSSLVKSISKTAEDYFINPK